MLIRNKVNKEMSVRSYKNEQDISKAYNYYIKVSNSIPAYMLRNLKEMPNNKGYMWKGVIHFGSKPSETNNPVVVFDKDNKTKVLTIHEWSHSEYKIYEKHGDGRKKLIKREKRRILKLE